MKKLVFILLSLSLNAMAQQTPADQLYRPLPFPNIGVVEVSHPERFNHVVAISDVHGMYKSLLRLLFVTRLIDDQGNWRGGKTLLIVNGDSIDKGPDSVYVIDFWIRLTRKAQANGGAIIHLLGNHEASFIDDPEGRRNTRFDEKDERRHINDAFRAELKRKNIPLQQFTDPKNERSAFLRSMPLAARIGNWLFCHAGLYPQMDWPSFAVQAKQILQSGAYENALIDGPNSILNAKNWWNDRKERSALENMLYSNHMYGVVFGHQHMALGGPKNQISASDNWRLVKIDTGMEPSVGSGGELLMFSHPAQMSTLSPPEMFAMGLGGVIRQILSK